MPYRVVGLVGTVRGVLRREIEQRDVGLPGPPRVHRTRVVGTYTDVLTYESTMGGEITIPSMVVDPHGMRLVQ
ncbi:MAG: hypothetical protein H0U13_01015 [Gemmatimonadaceae bacterium]|nr:hypothetical protein [Gemmatimonadaceae bacterium]